MNSYYKAESERTEEDRNALIPPFRKTDHDEEADRIETEIRHENYQLKQRVRILMEMLGEAWSAGAAHRLPTFGQLNTWREALSNK